MTDFDELASAYLDDAVTADERQRVDADPALRARVDELRRARDELAAAPVPPPDATVREAAVRLALDAANVVVLDRHPARRRLRLVSIAAAALVAITLAGLLIRARSNDTTNTASPVPRPAATESAAAAPANRAAGAPQQAYATAGALGSFSTRDELVTAVKTAITTPPTTSAAADTAAGPNGATTGTVPVCPTTGPPGATQVLLSSLAVLDGDAVQLDVYALSDGSRQLIVTKRLSCTEVFSQML